MIFISRKLIRYAKIEEIFGIDSFGDRQIRQFLSPEQYNLFRTSVDTGSPLEGSIADEV